MKPLTLLNDDNLDDIDAYGTAANIVHINVAREVAWEVKWTLIDEVNNYESYE
jgi:hypothetical protein